MNGESFRKKWSYLANILWLTTFQFIYNLTFHDKKSTCQAYIYHAAKFKLNDK